MSKPSLSINYGHLEDQLLKRTYKLSEVKDRIEKVAFDIVRFRDDDKQSQLWKIESCSDGDYIVTLYEEEPETAKTASASTWEVILSKASNTLNFFYKGAPITKMSAVQLGIPASELPMAERYLPNKLASNPTLVNALLNQLNAPAKNEVLSKYPELAKAPS